MVFSGLVDPGDRQRSPQPWRRPSCLDHRPSGVRVRARNVVEQLQTEAKESASIKVGEARFFQRSAPLARFKPLPTSLHSLQYQEDNDMATTAALLAFAAVGAVAHNHPNEPIGPNEPVEPNVNTATAPSAVYAAQATAATYDGRQRYQRGRAFDRYVEIWLENTDYDKAAGDPNLAWLASKGITLSNYYGVTHPSEPNYVAAIGGDNFGMDNDNFNQVADDVFTVTDLLEDKGISWGS